MTDDERAALVDLAVSVVESQGYLVSYSFKPKFQAILAAIEPAIRADERKRVVGEATTDEAVDRAVDAMGGRCWSDEMRAAILAALGDDA